MSSTKLITDWDLSKLYPEEDSKLETDKKLIQQKAKEFADKWLSRDDYLQDPNVLKQALDEYESWSRLYGTSGGIGYYWSLKSSLDQLDPSIKAKENQIDELGTLLYNTIQFFELRLAKVSPQVQKTFLDNKQLEPYRHFLSRLFAQSTYTLPEDQERVLNLMSQPAYGNWVRMTSTFLSQEERDILQEDGKISRSSFAVVANNMNSKDKQVRDAAAEAFNNIMAKYADVATEEINTVVHYKKVTDELRGMSRPDLGRHLSDDIDSVVVDTVISEVANKFDIPARYYALKAKLMGVDKLAYHERNIEYGEIGQKYSYEDAYGLVRKSLHSLDPEFSQILDQFGMHGQIDVFPKRGKHNGAFCACDSVSHPTYILLNFTGKLSDVLTLAHEVGHGINNELMRPKQNELNFGTPLSTAEVASTFMEDFVLQELLRDADDEQKLSIMMMKLNDDVSSIFRQVACYRFEQALHQQIRQRGYLSSTEIGEIFTDNMKSYMGPQVEQSSGSQNWWVYWSHIRTFFYVYSYASGLLISKSLQSLVRQDAKFITNVKDFLSTGMSDAPQDSFAKLGLKINQPDFWQRGLAEIDELLIATELLAKKLNKF
jgi:oligoendopeptidase F